ncbi:MAG: NUDIX hydrolase [Candidatus Bathyarchaeota archaeon]|nr:NUDIX hydrolase [Candidatus Bathyarchaeota archaeon]
MISQRDIPKGKILVSAYAIIEGKDDGILFIYEGDEPYHKMLVLPGGYVKANETLDQTVTREVEEETGLKVDSTEFVGIFQDFLTQEDEPINHIIAAYKVEVVGGRLIFSREATAYKWLTVEETKSSTEVPDVFKRILDAVGKEHKKRFPIWKTS